MNISKKQLQTIAYDLYVEEWTRTHVSTHRLLKALRDYHLIVLDGNYDDRYDFSAYLLDAGFDGELYVCFDEFCVNEFMDVNYIHALLEIPVLISAYDKIMTKNISNYVDCEFYSIEQDSITKEKNIHIWGYIYNAGTDEEKPYRDLEYTGFIISLKEFLSEGFDYDLAQSETKSYIADLTEEEAQERLKRYWHYHIFPNNDERPARLPFNQITMDTPCGEYVNYAESMKGETL